MPISFISSRGRSDLKGHQKWKTNGAVPAYWIIQLDTRMNSVQSMHVSLSLFCNNINVKHVVSSHWAEVKEISSRGNPQKESPYLDDIRLDG